jgi:hypothetical protein
MALEHKPYMCIQSRCEQTTSYHLGSNHSTRTDMYIYSCCHQTTCYHLGSNHSTRTETIHVHSVPLSTDHELSPGLQPWH